jgi:hypothetical protein
VKSPPQQPASALAGDALLAHYVAAARRSGESLYDESWVVPRASYFTWPKGKREGRCARTWGGTVFERLVRLGVLEKVEGPVVQEARDRQEDEP